MSHQISRRLWEILGTSDRLWDLLAGKALVSFERLGGMGRLWKASAGFGMLWEVVGGFGSLCETLQGFGGFRGLWQVLKALRTFSEALRGFGNMVCPLSGSWINHFIWKSLNLEIWNPKSIQNLSIFCPCCYPPLLLSNKQPLLLSILGEQIGKYCSHGCKSLKATTTTTTTATTITVQASH